MDNDIKKLRAGLDLHAHHIRVLQEQVAILNTAFEHLLDLLEQASPSHDDGGRSDG
jgi:hypothetical protein